MSLLYRILYGVGFTPWDRIHATPAGAQATSMIEEVEGVRPPPFGSALDLGCGSGIWTVDLARRGWDVTAVDIVPRAIKRARKRAADAGVEARFIVGDVTRLAEAGVGSGFRLVLDFGTGHNLAAEGVAKLGRAVTAITEAQAFLIVYAVAEGRGPGGTGMSRQTLEAAYPDWNLVKDIPMDTAGLPRPFARADPRWYMLQRGG